MVRKYMFKKFESLITSCKKHAYLNSNLRNIILKVISLIEESEKQFGFTYGVVCVEKTHGIVDLIIRFCNIHLFKCNEQNYMEQCIKVNNLLDGLWSSLDSIKINKSKMNLLKSINDSLYRFSYTIQNIVLYNIEVESKEIEQEQMYKTETVDENNTNDEVKIEEIKKINDIETEFENSSTLIEDIIEYFDKEFEDSKEDIYKFIDEH